MVVWGMRSARFLSVGSVLVELLGGVRRGELDGGRVVNQVATMRGRERLGMKMGGA